MDEPQLPAWSGWWTLLARKYSTYYNAMVRGSLLGDHENLVSGRRRAYHPPAGAHPRRQNREPTTQDSLGLQQDADRRRIRINRRNRTEARLSLCLHKSICMHLYSVYKAIHIFSLRS
jgi:hypothetical protein